jgi:hypothetical protein
VNIPGQQERNLLIGGEKRAKSFMCDGKTGVV